MGTHRFEHHFNRPCTDIFATIADIERYPEFVPNFRSVSVNERSGNEMTVQQRVGIGPLRLSFDSHATMTPPRRLEVTALPGQWPNFSLLWQLEERAGGCLLQLEVSVSDSPLTERLVAIFPFSAVFTAFVERIEQQ